MPAGFDQEIVQDFLTESGELLGLLEGDLVVLESTPRDPELLNKVFRALHTIKGSASFLQLTNLVAIAHCSESALNAARNGVVVVGPKMMNLLLEAVDILKTHMSQLAAGEELSVPRAELVAQLAAIGEGKLNVESDALPAQQAAAPAAEPAKQAAQSAATPSSGNVRKLELGPGKADLLEYLVADLDETMNKVQAGLNSLVGSQDVQTSAQSLADTCEQLGRCVDFFEHGQMGELAQAMAKAASKLTSKQDALGNVMPHLKSLCELVNSQAAGIKAGEVREVAADDLLNQLENAWTGAAQPVTPTPVHEPHPLAEPADSAKVATPTSASETKSDGKLAEKTGDKPADKGGEKHDTKAVENTIRVEVGRLESLMNLVGELVLQKNRIGALTRRAASATNADVELTEAMTAAAGTLDRVTSDIQLAVMRTRMQPLDKLFGRYPRLIRDLAAKTGKKIQLVIEGGDTEVDKSVIEELGDPLVHLLRNSCDHGLEMPEDRVKAGKSETGTLTLRASHEGSHVRVLVIDDGRGLSREKICKKAVERGLATAEQVATLSDREVWNFIFEAGFSTAEKVSDLSGRGVGMDVVRTNIQKLKGAIELSSELGKGTTISITIPLTVAILPAMMVGVGGEIYALPLGSILEIVRPQEDQISSIGGHRVMRLRDSVLPLVDAAELFNQPTDKRQESPFAVVLQQHEKRVGLMVTRLIGQQEVVIKALDETGASSMPKAVSGATVRDDGGVSLIVDVDRLISMAEGR
ncbi:MAG TPA: chemotaxis protein CheA [Phycisphaerales bacterium]|nr:chemotaxis protein CheA [Phycisphaerales bacterium]